MVAIELYDIYMYVEGICNTHTEYQTYDLKLALKNLQVTPLKSRQMPSFKSTAFELKALCYYGTKNAFNLRALGKMLLS